MAKKIAGFHVAGATGRGASTSITGEDIKRTITTLGWRSNCMVVGSEVDQDHHAVVVPQGDFVPLGKIARNLRGNGKSNIMASPLQGTYEYNDYKPTTAPAVLHKTFIDGEFVDPLEKGLRKCGVKTALIPKDQLDAAFTHFSSKIFNNTDANHCRILTREESISGIEGDQYADAINRRSSPGYPWSDQTEGHIGKTKWLGKDEVYVYDHPDLVQALDEREARAKQGLRTPTYWVDTLKDERRTLDKVAAAKTRVFSAGTMDYIILFRKYFLGFNAHIMKEKIENEIAVGINVYSPEWDRLARHLSRQGTKVIAGDFSNFDGSLNPQIVARLVDVINEWYDDGEENARIRRVLWEEITSSHHIFENNVYSWTHSQPSGNPATTIINSMYNSISMRIVYQIVMANTPFASLRYFSQFVSMISYGDDNVVNINDMIIDDFNQLSITEGYAQIGMTYTDEAKTGVLVPFRSLSDVKFLKRGFRKDVRYYAPLELDVIMEMPQWVKTDLNVVDNTVANVETALRELSLHPESVFNKYSQQLLKASRRFLPRQPEALTYLDYRLLDFNKYY